MAGVAAVNQDRSSLTPGAPKGRSSAYRTLADEVRTPTTGLADAAIDEELVLEQTTQPIDVAVIVNGRPPFGDRLGQHAADFRHQTIQTRTSNASGCRAWPDARAEARLAGIDIAHSNDHLLVHDQRLDRSLAMAACGSAQDLAGELGLQRFRTKRIQRMMTTVWTAQFE